METPIKNTVQSTVELPIKDTPNIKGHNRNNFQTKDKFHCTKWRLSYSSNTIKDLSTKDKKMARKQWVPNVSVIRRFHCKAN